MTTGKAILAVMAGIAAGAALGILFAPDKGANTRKKIVRKGEDLVDELGDTIEQKYEILEDRIEEKVKSIIDKYFRVKPMKDRKAEVVDN
jgi:gas vesicle protein